MDEFIKTKRKALNGRYYDYLFQVIKYLQTENLTKYAFYKLRNQAIEDIYKAQEENIPIDKIYKKGHAAHFQKKAEKLPKMGIIEQIANVIMVFFALFSILALIVYVYHLIVKDESFYSEGMYLFISVLNLRNMVIYGFLGAVVSIFLQKIDRTRKWIQAGIIGGLGLGIVLTLFAIEKSVVENIKVNVLIFIPEFIALAVLGYFTNDLISKKKFKVAREIENKE